MSRSSITWRWAAILGVWGLIGMLGFLILVQFMLVAFAPFGNWQRPGVGKVVITLVDHDEEGRITGKAWGRQDGKARTLRLVKEEAATLEVEEEVWILDSYYAGGARPDQFLFTPWRLLMEYPEPLLLLLLLLVRRLHRVQAKAIAFVPDIPRKVWRDEFHAKAARFAAPDDKPQP